jgi:riboflavin biosynthesis pyrimidine reductase
LSLQRFWPDPAAVTADEYAGARPPASRARPSVTSVMVSSLDGRAAVAGSSRPLGGPQDLQLLLALRRTADALLVGSRTVRAESYGPLPCPAVIVARSFDVPWQAGLFAAPGQVVHVYTGMPGAVPPVAADVDVVAVDDLTAVLADLRARGVERLLCEGGPTLNRALIAAGLLDELFLTLSPLVTGDDRQPAIVSGGALAAPVRLALRGVAGADGDLYLRYSV